MTYNPYKTAKKYFIGYSMNINTFSIPYFTVRFSRGMDWVYITRFNNAGEQFDKTERTPQKESDFISLIISQDVESRIKLHHTPSLLPTTDKK